MRGVYKATLGLAFLVLVARSAQAQRSPYHLHHEVLPGTATSVISLDPPDAANAVIQSSNLNGVTNGSSRNFGFFNSVRFTQTATVPSGSTVNYVVWMRKTVNTGRLAASASLGTTLDFNSRVEFCQGTAMTELTLTFAPYMFSCTTSAAVSVNPTRELSLIVSVRANSNITKTVQAELAIEGTPGGQYDSNVDTPIPPPPPLISLLAPTSGPANTTVTVSGSGFGPSKGTSTISFSGTPATPTSWHTGTIVVPVPVGTPTGAGSVSVTVGGLSNTCPGNNCAFTVIPPPTLTSISPTRAHVGDSVTITGANFLATQQTSTGTSTVKFFNGVVAAPSSWNDTSIVVPVPIGATAGPVVVTVSNQVSINSLAFTVVVPGTIGGAITRAADGSSVSGATVQAVLNGAVVASATTPANGTYNFTNLEPGTYNVRVLATGFSSEVRTVVLADSGTTTTTNLSLFRPGSISGSVTQAAGGAPIAGAALSVYAGPTAKAVTSTDANGNYSVTNLHPGAYTVQAADVGFRTKDQGTTVSENANLIANFTLDAAAAGPVSYVYDELNRLVSVIDPSGDAATYEYDKVGNLLSISRSGASAVSISEFTPNSAPVGASVTIYGTGFSTGSSNTVTFGAAQVIATAATSNQLTVTVPAGATTSQITISNTGPVATSRDIFTVTATSLGAPTITGFSPAIAASGASLTVTGTNFEPVTANDRVNVNLTFAALSTASTTNLTTSIPLATSSGPITVATPAGTASTTTDLFVPPAEYAVDQVEFTARMVIGGTQDVTINTANHIGLITFAGSAGQRVSLLGTNGMSGQVFAACDVNVSILTPYAKYLARPTCMEDSGFIDVVTLTATGTYTILVAPENPATGNITLKLYNVRADLATTIATDGTAATVNTADPGQNAKLTFSGTAGQRISLLGTDGMTGQGAECAVNVTIIKPDTTVLDGGTACMEQSGFIDPTSLPPGGLPATGTYTILVDPAGSTFGSLTLQLYTVTDFAGTITPGQAVTVPISTPGQNATLTFSGTALQWISLLGTDGMSNQILGCDVSVSILKPNNGGDLAPATCMEQSGFIDAIQLQETNTYTIVVNPEGQAKGNLTLTLYDVSDYVGTIAANGTPVTVPLLNPGQNGRLTFTGALNQRVSLVGTNGINGQIFATCDVNVSVLQPNNGGTLVSPTCMEGSGFVDAVQLPTAGDYTIFIDPTSLATGSLTLALYTVTDASGSVVINGNATSLATSTPGQNMDVTFAGAASQAVRGSTTTPGPSACATLKIVRQNGTTVVSSYTSCGSTITMPSTTLPAGETYHLIVDPSGTTAGAFTVSVVSP